MEDVENKTIEIEKDNKFYICDITIEYLTLNNYGSDRDGNRGISRTFIDDYIIEEVVVENNAGKEIDYFTEEEVPDWLYEKVEEEIF